MMSFEAVEGLKDKVQVVVNRVGLDNGHISLKKAKETIGRDIYWRLPNDYRVMVEMRNNGVPLIEQAPRAGITQSIVTLAEELSGQEKPADGDDPDGKGRWLNFWGKNKAKSVPADRAAGSRHRPLIRETASGAWMASSPSLRSSSVSAQQGSRLPHDSCSGLRCLPTTASRASPRQLSGDGSDGPLRGASPHGLLPATRQILRVSARNGDVGNDADCAGLCMATVPLSET